MANDFMIWLLLIGALFFLAGILLRNGIQIPPIVVAPPKEWERFAILGVGLLFIIIAVIYRLLGSGGPSQSSQVSVVSPTSIIASPMATLEPTSPASPTPTVIPSSTPSSSPTPPTLTNTIPPPTPTSGPPPIPVRELFDNPPQDDQIAIVLHVDVTSTSGKDRGEETVRAAVTNWEGRLSKLPESVRQRIIVRYVDDGGLPSTARQVADKVAALKNNVACVIGLNRSDTALEALKSYDNAELPVFSITATNIYLTNKDLYPHLMLRRMVATDEQNAQLAVEFIRSKKVTRLRIIYLDNVYGNALSDDVKNVAGKQGINVAKTPLSPTPTAEEITAAVQSVEATDQMVFFIGFYSQARDLFPKIRALNSQVLLFGSDGVNNEALLHDASSIVNEDQAKAVQGVYYTGISGSVVDFSALAALAESYKVESHTTKLPTYLGESYDAMSMCLEAIKRAVADVGGPTSANIRAEFQKLTNPEKGVVQEPAVDVVVGPYKFDQYGNLQNPVYVVREISGADWSKNPKVYEAPRG